MNKFIDMTKEEINRLTALMLEWHEDIDESEEYAPELRWWSDKDNGCVMAETDWNPCDPNSAQVQNYLIPALLDKGLEIVVTHAKEGYCIDIYRDGYTVIIDIICKSITKLNQTIAAACLEAWGIIKG